MLLLLKYLVELLKKYHPKKQRGGIYILPSVIFGLVEHWKFFEAERRTPSICHPRYFARQTEHFRDSVPERERNSGMDPLDETKKQLYGTRK